MIIGDWGTWRNSLLFLRPRRFGKSLWLSVLANYYDLRTAAEHEILFGDLAVARGGGPTPLAHRYFVMRWDFSKINPDPPPWGVNAHVDSRHERIGNQINGYLNMTIRIFSGTTASTCRRFWSSPRIPSTTSKSCFP